jgi:hypothetical protein
VEEEARDPNEEPEEMLSTEIAEAAGDFRTAAGRTSVGSNPLFSCLSISESTLDEICGVGGSPVWAPAVGFAVFVEKWLFQDVDRAGFPRGEIVAEKSNLIQKHFETLENCRVHPKIEDATAGWVGKSEN